MKKTQQAQPRYIRGFSELAETKISSAKRKYKPSVTTTFISAFYSATRFRFCENFKEFLNIEVKICLRVLRRCIRPTILLLNSRIGSIRQNEKNTTGKNYRPII
jgi:hypothetical protein